MAVNMTVFWMPQCLGAQLVSVFAGLVGPLLFPQKQLNPGAI